MTLINTVIGIVVIIVGFIGILKPEVLLNLQLSGQRKMWGLKVKPTKQSYATMRVVSVVFVIIGIVVLFLF
ncbi:hypothetical protein COV18_00325 [Candidatus Woesearchaeota archaeon CG10_big_fil_rev_8_21_14_0_10_37_12]|nr:MAG: hypothetical protein COV18_00325 [Candidatus Woesearchaeota archaeon CG10_big_fil_rev_8_21_14_0_10_37_12]